MEIRRLASIKNIEEFDSYLKENGIKLPLTRRTPLGKETALHRPYSFEGKIIGNRFCILPMEGWDGTLDGHPTELVQRRWSNFGRSGAKLVWGGEAVAVCNSGRANPHQLLMNEETVDDIAHLRRTLVSTHEQYHGSGDYMYIGLQLTHSGRFSCPHDISRREPVILYNHPLLDKKFGLADDHPIMTDDEIADLEEDYIKAAVLAQRAGFDFVDIKHCHGYLGHEFLTAFDRPGRYGGSFANRTRFLSEVVEGIRSEAPGLVIGVRLSAFDFIPFQKGENGQGVPMAFENSDYHYAFGGDGTGTGVDLKEPTMFLKKLVSLGINMVCITAGSPYYVPHIQRPAWFPPSDGYQPPEDPLVGVARLISATAILKRVVPEITVVGSGYSYLQEWLPNVADAVIANGDADFVGYGRLALSYPEFAADVLAGKPLTKNKICRTFSDCTTAPRLGLVSGCFPLDEYYRELPDYAQLEANKKSSKQG
jgi:2,4-dienoyl-CoA reductase-like NADH-dependent reductase (Old Yellow Enzyme family)